MDYDTAVQVLRERGWIDEGGNLHDVGAYISWGQGQTKITLDGEFTPRELEAVVFYTRGQKRRNINGG